MAWFLRSKLNSLLIIDFKEIRKSLYGSSGLSKNSLTEIENEIEKTVKKKFWSLDDVVSYAERRQKPYYDCGNLYRWLKVGNYLILFTRSRGSAQLGFPDMPLEYIYRAGQSAWFVMDFSPQVDGSILDIISTLQ